MRFSQCITISHDVNILY